MANVIRYKTSQPTKRGKRRGNVVVGIGEENYGPSSTTGYVNGITPPDGGYVIYTLSGGNDPAIYVANSDDDLPAIARTLGGGELDYLAAKNYLNSRSNTWILDSTPNNTIADGLVLDLNAKNISSFVDNKPIENLVPSGGRTGDSALPRQSYHIRVWTYSIEQNFVGRDSVIKLYINPPGTDSTAPYADYGFYAYRSGGSQVGDVYTISMDYYVAKGNSSPAITIAYANGYKNPTSAQAASWGSATITDLGNGWYRRTQSATITIAGNTWWRGGLGSNNIETEAYIDNIQVEFNPTATPFVDGIRSQNTEWKDISGEGNNGTLTNGPTFENGAIVFDGSNDYATISSDSSFNVNTRTVELTFKMNGSYSNFSPLAIYANGSSTSNRVWLGIQDGKFRMHGWGTSDPAATTTIDADRWYTCVWSYDKGTQKMKMYTNGVLENDHSQTQGGVNGVSGNNWYLAYIPGSWQSQTYSNVSINSFKIYDKILSNEEVSTNYYGGPIVTDGLTYAIDASNLVSYESGSTTVYSMTGSLDDTLINGVGYTLNNGGGWIFDGTNDNLDADVQLNYGGCSVEIIAKWSTLNDLFCAGSGAAGAGLTGGTNFRAHMTTSGFYVALYSPPGGPGGWNTSGTVSSSSSTNTTYHITVVNVGTVWYFYKNGTLAGSVDALYTPNSASTRVGIFRNHVQTVGNAGNVHLFRVYGKSLSASEVLQNYNAQKTRFGL